MDKESEKNLNWKNKEYCLEEALEIAGLGWYNIKYCLVLALILVAAIVEVIGYAYVLPTARCDLQMTDAQRGVISSLPYAAIILTSFPWGYLVDTRGRKCTIVTSCTLMGIIGILAGFMPDIVTFAGMKFLASLCLACAGAAPYPLIGEILPKQHRDLALSVVNALQTTGTALVPLLAWGILSFDFKLDLGLYEFRPWRLLSMVYSSIFILCAVLMSFGPESPKYLISKGRCDEALEVLKKMYSGNNNKLPEDYPVKRLLAPENTVNQGTSFITSLKEQTVPVLKPPYLKWLLLTGYLLFGVFSILNGLFMWVPDVINRVFSGTSTDMTACEVIRLRFNQTVTSPTHCDDTMDPRTFKITATANISCAIITLLISFLLKVIGKRLMLILLYFTIGVFCISINFIKNQVLFAILLSSLQIIALGIGPVNAYAVEIFPTYLRGMAVSLSIMFGRIASAVGTNVAGILINNACEVTFYSFGGQLLVCGFLSFLLPNPKRRSS